MFFILPLSHRSSVPEKSGLPIFFKEEKPAATVSIRPQLCPGPSPSPPRPHSHQALLSLGPPWAGLLPPNPQPKNRVGRVGRRGLSSPLRICVETFRGRGENKQNLKTTKPIRRGH